MVLREPGFNAAVAPGGLIVLRTGALLRCRDEAELALVLAHEMAHERRGDARERWRSTGARSGDTHHAAPSREAEASADAAAWALLAEAGYDTGSAERLWQRLLAEDDGHDEPGDADAGHPPAAERLAAFRAMPLQTPEKGIDGDTASERWLRAIAPYRQDWLDVEIARGRPEATVAMLESSLTAATESPALDEFALAQALRHRDAPGDRTRAATLYAQAVGRPKAPAAAWREHGLSLLEAGDAAGGRAALASYLEREPDAADADFVRAMLAGAAPAGRDDGPPPSPRGSGRELRVFDLRLRTALPWRRHRGIALEQWTLDGLEANRLLVVPNLRPGEPLFRDAGRNGPRHRPGSRPDEQRDRIVAALDAAGWREVRADGPRRHDFGGVPGWQSNLALSSADGIRYGGSAVFVERDGRLTLLLWFATAEEHFPRDAAAVQAMFASARFGR